MTSECKNLEPSEKWIYGRKIPASLQMIYNVPLTKDQTNVKQVGMMVYIESERKTVSYYGTRQNENVRTLLKTVLHI